MKKKVKRAQIKKLPAQQQGQNKPAPLSPAKAKDLIDSYLKDGIIELTDHCKYDSMPDRNVEMEDILNVLSTGTVQEPEWDDDYGNWQHRVTGKDLEGDKLTAVTVIIQRNATLLIITVF